MAEQQVQLTFEVGGNPPTDTVLRMSGGVFTHRELAKGEEIHLQVVDADGQVVADGYGRVVGVAFKDKIEDGVVVQTERVHTLKVT